MTDLVERLRDVRRRFESGTPQFTDQLEFVTSEAADEIERLQTRVAELERDAARYRWLRQERYMFREGAVVTCDEQAETVALWVKCPVTNCICEVDAAIDADMKEQP